MTMTLSRELVRLLCGLAKSGIPPKVTAKTRLHIADAIGIGLAAWRGSTLAQQVTTALGSGVNAASCGVLGSRQSMPPANAAFANSALVHMLDYDDIHDAARLHPSAVTLPAALAATGLMDASERTLVDAVTLGNELMCRMGSMYLPTGEGPGSDWFLTQLFGYFGAALTCALVLGMSEDEIVSALGLAYMQAAGGKEAGFGVGSTARGIYPAFAAMGGVQAALLARAGVAGPASALDGAAGLFRIYLGAEADDAKLQTLLDAHSWFFLDTEVKPWPSCRLSHPYVAAALAVRVQLARAPVRAISVAVNASAAKLCRPLAARRRPETLQDGKYSIPFMIAFTLVRGKVDLETLNSEALDDTAVLALAERVTIVESLPDKPGHPAAEITVETASASFHSPKNLDLQLPPAGVREKFLSCLRYAGASGAEALWDRLQQPGTGNAAELLRAIPNVQ